MDKILHLNYAKRGTGTTVMDGATRARLMNNINTKMSRPGGAEVAARSYKTGAAPQVVIETENFEDVVAAITNLMDNQTIVLGYADGTALGRKLTVKFATGTAVGDSELPPAEGEGNVPRYQITLDVHQGTAVTTLAQALVDVAEI